MKDGPWLKRIGIGLCFVMLFFVLFTYLKIREENIESTRELIVLAEEYNTTMRPLWTEKAKLEREIEKLEEEQEYLLSGPAVLMLLCAEPNAKVLEDILPMLRQYDYTAALVLTEDQFPGNEGCLTWRETYRLINEDWELCIGINSDTDIDDLYEKIIDDGFPKPVAAYFPSGVCTEEQKETILNLGIHTIICYGKKVEQDISEDVWYVSAFGSNESNSKNVFLSSVDEPSPLVLTVGYSHTAERYDTTNYGNMLRTINKYEQSENVYVKSIHAAYRDYRANEANFGEDYLQSQRHLSELKARLDEINEAFHDEQKN